MAATATAPTFGTLDAFAIADVRQDPTKSTFYARLLGLEHLSPGSGWPMRWAPVDVLVLGFACGFGPFKGRQKIGRYVPLAREGAAAWDAGRTPGWLVASPSGDRVVGRKDARKLAADLLADVGVRVRVLRCGPIIDRLERALAAS